MIRPWLWVIFFLGWPGQNDQIAQIWRDLEKTLLTKKLPISPNNKNGLTESTKTQTQFLNKVFVFFIYNLLTTSKLELHPKS